MKVLILSSTGFSNIGWVSGPSHRKALADSLMRAEIDVDFAEVASVDELDRLLSLIDPETLVWPNAYYVHTHAGGDEKEWLGEILEAASVAYVGSPAGTLRAMLHKDICQTRLAEAGLPVPRFAVVTRDDADTIRGALETADLSWPVVVKPTSEFDSLGILAVGSVEKLCAQVGHVLNRYGPKAIIEEYLPSADITVGVLLRGTGTTLLTTWYEMTDRDGILDHPVRVMPWGGPKQMRLVEDPDILEQVERIAPLIAEELGVRDFTRIDGRLDARGQLKIFDVNGMPSLDYPHTVTLRQLMTVWDGMDALSALEQLSATLVASAAARYGLETPPGITERVLPITGPPGLQFASNPQMAATL